MKSYKNLWSKLCSYDNLEKAYKKARMHKTFRSYVMDFEKNLENNLLSLSSELASNHYKPKPLKAFIVRDPKTRKICKSEFRDRVVHHAICNILEPIFDRIFIYDSYANRLNKGTLNALERFDFFKRKIGRNDTLPCYVLKADIRKYFENIDHNILLNMVKRKINDTNVLHLINVILANYATEGGGRTEKGMPLGNLTSQFFANVYLNELDYFVKHNLKIKYYIRYVDDFIILHNNKNVLGKFKFQINDFLKNKLKIELHPDKSKIINLDKGINFLGFRVFYSHRLLRKTNLKIFKRKLEGFKASFSNNEMNYDRIYESIQGWNAYARFANTYVLRKELGKKTEAYFPNQTSSAEINRIIKLKH